MSSTDLLRGGQKVIIERTEKRPRFHIQAGKGNLLSSKKPISISCPNCSSTRLHRSRSRGQYENLLKYFNQRAYRCKDCGWRGKIKAKNRRERKSSITLGRVIGFLIAVGAALFILSHFVDQLNE
jgi:hypothetical protein